MQSCNVKKCYQVFRLTTHSSSTCLNFENFVWIVLPLPWNCPDLDVCETVFSFAFPHMLLPSPTSIHHLLPQMWCDNKIFNPYQLIKITKCPCWLNIKQLLHVNGIFCIFILQAIFDFSSHATIWSLLIKKIHVFDTQSRSAHIYNSWPFIQNVTSNGMWFRMQLPV